MRRADSEKGEKDKGDVILLKDKFFANTTQVEPMAEDATKPLKSSCRITGGQAYKETFGSTQWGVKSAKGFNP